MSGCQMGLILVHRCGGSEDGDGRDGTCGIVSSTRGGGSHRLESYRLAGTRQWASVRCWSLADCSTPVALGGNVGA